MLLLKAVKRISEQFSILKEARREVLEDLMDIKNAQTVLKAIEDNKIAIAETTTRIPSPFALNLVLEGYSDVLKIEERQAFLQRMHTMILAKIALNKRLPANARKS
jgi:ATP-dependent Lhr-like helicase